MKTTSARLPYCGRIEPANAQSSPTNPKIGMQRSRADINNGRVCVLKLKLNFLLVVIGGMLLVPAASTIASAQSGIASVYSTSEGTRTASGRRLSNGALTAAHKSLPFGTKVRVTNKRNGRSVTVTITDRGPFVRGRVIDLTPAGARALGFNGLAPVSLSVGG
jgi:rare lipoprotein A